MPAILNNKLKLISWLVLASFLAQDAAWAAPGTPMTAPSPPLAAQAAIAPFIQNPSQLSIPLEAVTLQEVHAGTNGKLIIHIQDAHANLSGQQNLAKALDHLLSRYDLKTVLVEGSARDSSLDEIRKLAPLREWKIIARRFLYDGVISGEEYLNLTSEHPMKILGVEYRDLYDESVKAYAALVDRRKDILHYLYQAKVSLDRLKNRYYPETLKNYEAKKASGDSGGAVDFKSGFSDLLELADGAGFSLSDGDFGEVLKLKDLLEQESSIDFTQANREQQRILDLLAAGGAQDEVREFLESSKRLKSSQVSQYLLLQKLLQSARGKMQDAAAFTEIKKYEAYLSRFLDLRFDALLAQLEALEDGVYEKILTSADARKIRAIDRFLGLLGNAYKLQMSSRDFKTFNLNEQDFPTESWLAFMNQKLSELGFFESMVPYENYLEGARKDFGRFYELVDRRDQAFVQNADRLMREQKTDAAVLIAGGYHTAHLTELLRAAGTSYVVLTPVVTDSTDHERYEELLLSRLKAQEKKLAGRKDTGVYRAQNVAATKIPRGLRIEDSVSGGRLGENLPKPDAQFAAARLAGLPDQMKTVAARLAEKPENELFAAVKSAYEEARPSSMTIESFKDTPANIAGAVALSLAIQEELQTEQGIKIVTFGADEFKIVLNDRDKAGLSRIAKAGDKVIGYLAAGEATTLSGQSGTYIYDFGVAKSHRKWAVGLSLLNALAQDLVSDRSSAPEKQWIYLEVQTDNPRAFEYWSKRGCESMGVYTDTTDIVSTGQSGKQFFVMRVKPERLIQGINPNRYLIQPAPEEGFSSAARLASDKSDDRSGSPVEWGVEAPAVLEQRAIPEPREATDFFPTANTSYLNRHRASWEELRKRVLPKLAEAALREARATGASPEIRIADLGSSTGEEVGRAYDQVIDWLGENGFGYPIATTPDQPGWRVRVTGIEKKFTSGNPTADAARRRLRGHERFDWVRIPRLPNESDRPENNETKKRQDADERFARDIVATLNSQLGVIGEDLTIREADILNPNEVASATAEAQRSTPHLVLMNMVFMHLHANRNEKVRLLDEYEKLWPEAYFFGTQDVPWNESGRPGLVSRAFTERRVIPVQISKERSGIGEKQVYYLVEPAAEGARLAGTARPAELSAGSEDAMRHERVRSWFGLKTRVTRRVPGRQITLYSGTDWKTAEYKMVLGWRRSTGRKAGSRFEVQFYKRLGPGGGYVALTETVLIPRGNPEAALISAGIRTLDPGSQRAEIKLNQKAAPDDLFSIRVNLWDDSVIARNPDGRGAVLGYGSTTGRLSEMTYKNGVWQREPTARERAVSAIYAVLPTSVRRAAHWAAALAGFEGARLAGDKLVIDTVDEDKPRSGIVSNSDMPAAVLMGDYGVIVQRIGGKFQIDKLDDNGLEGAFSKETPDSNSTVVVNVGRATSESSQADSGELRILMADRTSRISRNHATLTLSSLGMMIQGNPTNGIRWVSGPQTLEALLNFVRPREMTGWKARVYRWVGRSVQNPMTREQEIDRIEKALGILAGDIRVTDQEREETQLDRYEQLFKELHGSQKQLVIQLLLKLIHTQRYERRMLLLMQRRDEIQSEFLRVAANYELDLAELEEAAKIRAVDPMILQQAEGRAAELSGWMRELAASVSELEEKALGFRALSRNIAAYRQRILTAVEAARQRRTLSYLQEHYADRLNGFMEWWRAAGPDERDLADMYFKFLRMQADARRAMSPLEMRVQMTMDGHMKFESVVRELDQIFGIPISSNWQEDIAFSEMMRTVLSSPEFAADPSTGARLAERPAESAMDRRGFLGRALGGSLAVSLAELTAAGADAEEIQGNLTALFQLSSLPEITAEDVRIIVTGVAEILADKRVSYQEKYELIRSVSSSLTALGHSDALRDLFRDLSTQAPEGFLTLLEPRLRARAREGWTVFVTVAFKRSGVGNLTGNAEGFKYAAEAADIASFFSQIVSAEESYGSDRRADREAFKKMLLLVAKRVAKNEKIIPGVSQVAGFFKSSSAPQVSAVDRLSGALEVLSGRQDIRGLVDNELKRFSESSDRLLDPNTLDQELAGFAGRIGVTADEVSSGLPVLRMAFAAAALVQDPDQAWAREVFLRAAQEQVGFPQEHLRMAQSLLPVVVDVLDGGGIRDTSARALVRIGVYTMLAHFGGIAAPFLTNLLLNSRIGLIGQEFVVELIVDLSQRGAQVRQNAEQALKNALMRAGEEARRRLKASADKIRERRQTRQAVVKTWFQKILPQGARLAAKPGPWERAKNWASRAVLAMSLFAGMGTPQPTRAEGPPEVVERIEAAKKITDLKTPVERNHWKLLQDYRALENNVDNRNTVSVAGRNHLLPNRGDRLDVRGQKKRGRITSVRDLLSEGINGQRMVDEVLTYGFALEDGRSYNRMITRGRTYDVYSEDAYDRSGITRSDYAYYVQIEGSIIFRADTLKEIEDFLLKDPDLKTDYPDAYRTLALKPLKEDDFGADSGFKKVLSRDVKVGHFHTALNVEVKTGKVIGDAPVDTSREKIGDYAQKHPYLTVFKVPATKALFDQWNAVRDGSLDRKSFDTSASAAGGLGVLAVVEEHQQYFMITKGIQPGVKPVVLIPGEDGMPETMFVGGSEEATQLDSSVAAVFNMPTIGWSTNIDPGQYATLSARVAPDSKAEQLRAATQLERAALFGGFVSDGRIGVADGTDAIRDQKMAEFKSHLLSLEIILSQTDKSTEEGKAFAEAFSDYIRNFSRTGVWTDADGRRYVILYGTVRLNARIKAINEYLDRRTGDPDLQTPTEEELDQIEAEAVAFHPVPTIGTAYRLYVLVEEHLKSQDTAWLERAVEKIKKFRSDSDQALSPQTLREAVWILDRIAAGTEDPGLREKARAAALKTGLYPLSRTAFDWRMDYVAKHPKASDPDYPHMSIVTGFEDRLEDWYSYLEFVVFDPAAPVLTVRPGNSELGRFSRQRVLDAAAHEVGRLAGSAAEADFRATFGSALKFTQNDLYYGPVDNFWKELRAQVDRRHLARDAKPAVKPLETDPNVLIDDHLGNVKRNGQVEELREYCFRPEVSAETKRAMIEAIGQIGQDWARRPRSSIMALPDERRRGMVEPTEFTRARMPRFVEAMYFLDELQRSDQYVSGEAGGLDLSKPLAIAQRKLIETAMKALEEDLPKSSVMIGPWTKGLMAILFESNLEPQYPSELITPLERARLLEAMDVLLTRQEENFGQRGGRGNSLSHEFYLLTHLLAGTTVPQDPLYPAIWYLVERTPRPDTSEFPTYGKAVWNSTDAILSRYPILSPRELGPPYETDYLQHKANKDSKRLDHSPLEKEFRLMMQDPRLPIEGRREALRNIGRTGSSWIEEPDTRVIYNDARKIDLSYKGYGRYGNVDATSFSRVHTGRFVEIDRLLDSLVGTPGYETLTPEIRQAQRNLFLTAIKALETDQPVYPMRSDLFENWSEVANAVLYDAQGRPLNGHGVWSTGEIQRFTGLYGRLYQHLAQSDRDLGRSRTETPAPFYYLTQKLLRTPELLNTPNIGPWTAYLAGQARQNVPDLRTAEEWQRSIWARARQNIMGPGAETPSQSVVKQKESSSKVTPDGARLASFKSRLSDLEIEMLEHLSRVQFFKKQEERILKAVIQLSFARAELNRKPGKKSKRKADLNAREAAALNHMVRAWINLDYPAGEYLASWPRNIDQQEEYESFQLRLAAIIRDFSADRLKVATEKALNRIPFDTQMILVVMLRRMEALLGSKHPTSKFLDELTRHVEDFPHNVMEGEQSSDWNLDLKDIGIKIEKWMDTMMHVHGLKGFDKTWVTEWAVGHKARKELALQLKYPAATKNAYDVVEALVREEINKHPTASTDPQQLLVMTFGLVNHLAVLANAEARTLNWQLYTYRNALTRLKELLAGDQQAGKVLNELFIRYYDNDMDQMLDDVPPEESGDASDLSRDGHRSRAWTPQKLDAIYRFHQEMVTASVQPQGRTPILLGKIREFRDLPRVPRKKALRRQILEELTIMKKCSLFIAAMAEEQSKKRIIVPRRFVNPEPGEYRRLGKEAGSDDAEDTVDSADAGGIAEIPSSGDSDIYLYQIVEPGAQKRKVLKFLNYQVMTAWVARTREWLTHPNNLNGGIARYFPTFLGVGILRYDRDFTLLDEWGIGPKNFRTAGTKSATYLAQSEPVTQTLEQYLFAEPGKKPDVLKTLKALAAIASAIDDLHANKFYLGELQLEPSKILVVEKSPGNPAILFREFETAISEAEGSPVRLRDLRQYVQKHLGPLGAYIDKDKPEQIEDVDNEALSDLMKVVGRRMSNDPNSTGRLQLRLMRGQGRRPRPAGEMAAELEKLIQKAGDAKGARLAPGTRPVRKILSEATGPLPMTRVSRENLTAEQSAFAAAAGARLGAARPEFVDRPLPLALGREDFTVAQVTRPVAVQGRSVPAAVSDNLRHLLNQAPRLVQMLFRAVLAEFPSGKEEFLFVTDLADRGPSLTGKDPNEALLRSLVESVRGSSGIELISSRSDAALNASDSGRYGFRPTEAAVDRILNATLKGRYPVLMMSQERIRAWHALLREAAEKKGQPQVEALERYLIHSPVQTADENEIYVNYAGAFGRGRWLGAIKHRQPDRAQAASTAEILTPLGMNLLKGIKEDDQQRVLNHLLWMPAADAADEDIEQYYADIFAAALKPFDLRSYVDALAHAIREVARFA